MAEREGFEPSIGVTYTHFPGVLLRPLGHLSVEVTHSATPKRPGPLLPLLPSGPGGVHSKLPQGDQVDHHRAAYASRIRMRMKSETGAKHVTRYGCILNRAKRCPNDHTDEHSIRY